MDEPWRDHAKLNKPTTKEQIVWFHLYEVPRTLKFIETESSRVVVRHWEGERIGSYSLIGMEFQFKKMKSLEMDGNNSCKTMWMDLMPLNLNNR